MIRHVLDTDMLSLLEKGHPKVSQRFLQQPLGSVAVSVLSVEEQLSGWYTQLRRTKRHDRLAQVYGHIAEIVEFRSHLRILTYKESAMRRYELLRKQKIKIGRSDLGIAATVLEEQLTVVTRNLRDFQQVPGLQIEDWSQ